MGRGRGRENGVGAGPVVASGAAATVLYAQASDPALTQPRGRQVAVLRRRRMADLAVDEVAATLPLG